MLAVIKLRQQSNETAQAFINQGNNKVTKQQRHLLNQGNNQNNETALAFINQGNK